MPVSLEASAADSSARSILASADTLALRVARLIRASISGSADSLPEGEALLHRRGLGGALRVVVHRDGRFTWSLPPRRSSADALIYQTVDHRVMVVPFRIEGDTFVASPPHPWPAPPLADAGVFPAFDATPDGQHLVALLPAARRPAVATCYPGEGSRGGTPQSEWPGDM